MADLRPRVVLDLVQDGTPSYYTHGRAACIGCRRWVWLGSETVGPVSSRSVDPLCVECANLYTPPTAKRLGRLNDHQRDDGPHPGGCPDEAQ